MSIPKNRKICYTKTHWASPNKVICFDAGRVITKAERRQRRIHYDERKKWKQKLIKAVLDMIDNMKKEGDKPPEQPEDIMKEVEKGIRQEIDKKDTTPQIKQEIKKVLDETINEIEEREEERTAPVPEKDIISVADCIEEITKIYSLIYGRSKPKSLMEALSQNKQRNDLRDIILGSDFYPTPAKYGEIIYNDVRSLWGEVEIDYIVDVGAGLASLTMPFILNPTNINNIVLIEKEEPLYNVLKCFNKLNKVKVLKNDFFDINFDNFFLSKTNTVILCNPPYRGLLDGKHRNNLWLYFVYSIINDITNINIQNAYFILPLASKYFYNADTRKELKFNDEGANVYLEIGKNDMKNITYSLFGEIDDEPTTIEYFKYITKVTGFKGLTKAGKPRKSADAILLRYGI